MRIVVVLFAFVVAGQSASPARAAQDACASGEISVSGTMGGGIGRRDPSGTLQLSFQLRMPSCGSSSISVKALTGEPICGYGKPVLVSGDYYAPGASPTGNAFSQAGNLPVRPMPTIENARLECPLPVR